jgi:hypothetical protein
MKILLAILMVAVPVFGQTPAGPVQGPPPKNLTKQPDGHVSANTDPANPEKFETHVVLAGETLSEISGVVLKDSKLWPQLWEMNEHIVNPHWIYPNDKILIRPVTKITEATPPAPAEQAAAPVPPPTPAPAAPAAVVAPPAPPAPPPVPASVGIGVLGRLLANSSPAVPRAADVLQISAPRLVPALKSTDVYCSGFIRSTPVSDLLQVSSTYQRDKSSFSTQGEYVRINHGSKGDVTVGSMYQVVRATRKVSNPDGGLGSSLGMHYLDVGQLQIVQVQEDYSLAQVLYSCDALEPSDVLLPYVHLDAPELPRNRTFSSVMKATGNIKGTVAFFRNSVAVTGSVYSSSTPPSAKSIVGTGGVVYLNVGETAGVKPGDLFIVYRGSAAIAEVAVLKVEEKASTALVTYSTDAVVLGDRVERR